jgi:dynein heavy chain
MSATDLLPRFKWASQRISACFSLPVSQAENFLAHRTNRAAFMDLLNPGGPQKLAVFYQATDAGAVELFFADPAKHPVTGDSRCCYFIRTCASDNKIKTDVLNDGNLTAGVLADRAWEDLHRSLMGMYLPLLQTRTAWGGANAGETSGFLSGMEGFADDLEKAVSGLFGGLTLKAPSQKVLDAIMARRSNDEQTKAVDKVRKIILGWCDHINAALKESHEDLAKLKSKSGSISGGDGDSSVSHLLKSPIFELEYWRHRTQSLTSIVEQLQQPQHRACVSVLGSRAKIALAANRRTIQEQGREIQVVLQQWKEVDSQLTEATIEAKDNFKYLGTMKKFFEPLSVGTPPREVASTLPALLNSIKMIFTISRYFGTPQRISALFAKITHQMIRNCRMYAKKRMQSIVEDAAKTQGADSKSATKEEAGDGSTSSGVELDLMDKKPAAVLVNVTLWDIDDESRSDILSRCMRLNELYQAEYLEVKQAMEEARNEALAASQSIIGGGGSTRSVKKSSYKSGGDSMSNLQDGEGAASIFGAEDQKLVFGEFDMFCRRLIKLEDLFSMIRQFQPLLGSKDMEMRSLVDEFKSIVNDLQKKRHDLLKFENAQFDRDYLEFSVRYSELLDRIQYFVNRSFSETLNVRDGYVFLFCPKSTLVVYFCLIPPSPPPPLPHACTSHTPTRTHTITYQKTHINKPPTPPRQCCS